MNSKGLANVAGPPTIRAPHNLLIRVESRSVQMSPTFSGRV